MDDNFLLQGKTAESLYNRIAKNAPIYDYHCHLTAKEIYEDRVFEGITQLWLKHDHYKWRAMRYAGVPERYITGDAGDLEKFGKWAKVCQGLIGSPLYNWANMELKTYFDIGEVLTEKNAERLFGICDQKIKDEKISPVKLITKSNVKLICTTDDPIDTLEYHKLLKSEKNLPLKVLPAFRPDNALNLTNDSYHDYISQLSETSSLPVMDYNGLIEALKQRIGYFDDTGCLISDHSLENFSYLPAGEGEVSEIFRRRLSGRSVTGEEALKFKSLTLVLLASEYRKRGWVMQLHTGAMRNVNEVMYKNLGADSGYDIMNDLRIASSLVGLLDRMNSEDNLPKTILYSLNPKDNTVLSAIPHCFTEAGVPGKVQFGAAWWFNDNKEGIYSHLKSISSQGMLADFIGMLTDSRSFLSYVRHDYFRRILCSFIGKLVDEGEFESDEAVLEDLVRGVCCKNIKRYLGLEERV